MSEPTGYVKPLTLAALQTANADRTQRHEGAFTTQPAAVWLADATAGIGAAALIAKIDAVGEFTEEDEDRMRNAVADTIIGMDLVASYYGFDTGAEVRRRFNDTSRALGTNEPII